MRFKKVLLAIISVAYTLVLVHNLTPHRHDKSQNELNSKTEPLLNWFNFIFGPEHENSVQDEDHLARFILSENDDSDELSTVIQFDENELLVCHFSEVYVAEKKSIFFHRSENCLFSSEIIYSGSSHSGQNSGRAPPVI